MKHVIKNYFDEVLGWSSHKFRFDMLKSLSNSYHFSEINTQFPRVVLKILAVEVSTFATRSELQATRSDVISSPFNKATYVFLLTLHPIQYFYI